jgi:hypothetical protein
MKKELLTFLIVVSGFISMAQTTFNYTGAVQTYIVPIGVSTISVDVAGAREGKKMQPTSVVKAAVYKLLFLLRPEKNFRFLWEEQEQHPQV